ncbi:MAG: sigma-54 dependent transcriptional regulator [Alistipes sp.]|nr:sigma-54 dependent transcriptional regulator [Alistipes sp.]
MAENIDITSVKQRFGIIGNSELLNRALSVALRVAPTDLSVLVVGESGVGKEFFPQIIHAYSARKHAKYIAVNCGAIPEGTIDSELFGHEKGAFTGATEARKGYFEEADGGTIFLDEVGELPLSTQVGLLRVLQSGEFLRVGSAKVQRTDVRVVAATNNDLLKSIETGRFREDLYYRLNTVPIAVPALRDRPEDIPLLFRKFASDVAVQYHMPAVTLDDGARQLLQNYYWRGNIRQLKNVAEQISALERTRTITADVLSGYLTPVQPSSSAVAPSGTAAHTGDMSTERELLYKILFDMRSDINDLKRMLTDLMQGAAHRAPAAPSQPHEVIGLLPSVSHPAVVDYAESEEVTEEAPHAERTKADVQRELIVRALRNNNGRRRDAARELFMSERTLYRRIKELGITDDDI